MEREKSRLTGELEATKKRLGELETKCSEEFDCEITALPGFIKQLEEEAEKSLKNAENVLGMGEDAPAKPDDGTSGQDRESYSDDQDRDDYVPEEDDEDALV
jgi:hypothetical protein